MNDLLNFYNDHKMQVAVVSGLLVGLALGLLVGWVLWPTGFINSTPAMLRSDFRDEYLLWVAQDFAVDEELDVAQARLGVEFWRDGTSVDALRDLAERLGGEDGARLTELAGALEAAPVPTRPSTLERARPVFTICGILLVTAALAGLIYFGLRRLLSPRGGVSERAIASRRMEPVMWAEEEQPPIAQFVTTYALGDDYYDPSFSIETEIGDFVGECGVGISETIGLGDPKKVTALEVWLFDKNDIRTVTKVLLSDYAFRDESLRARLAAKGDLVKAEAGREVVLETATLVLRARVLEMEYGEGPLPPQSFVQRMSLELGVWITEEGGEATEAEFPIPSTL